MTNTRSLIASQSRRLREEKKALRELERQAKEAAKLDALEQARLEVATYDARIAALLSIHKECTDATDWNARASELPPLPPARLTLNELTGRQTVLLIESGLRTGPSAPAAIVIEAAQKRDDYEFEKASSTYARERIQWQQRVSLADRVINNDTETWERVLSESRFLEEIDDLAADATFVAHGAHLIECRLLVNGPEIIPTDTKSLTASGKLSIKPTARAQFHEMFQDYLCGCVLRVLREILAILPVEAALITAAVEAENEARSDVLSLFARRSETAQIWWETTDASDTVEGLFHRGDFKVTRKSGAFAPILPLTVSDIRIDAGTKTPLSRTLADARALLAQLEQAAEDIRAGTTA